MSWESINDSHGLPTDVSRRMLEARKGILSLQTLVTDVVLDALFHNKYSEAQLCAIPAPLLKLILLQCSNRGIPCTSLLHKLLTIQTDCINLKSCIPSEGLNYILPATLYTITRFQSNLQILILDDNDTLLDNNLMHIKNLKCLRILSLAGCSRLSNALFNHIRDLPNLQKLSLARISRVTSSGVAKLWTGTESQLETIDLSKTQVEEKPGALNLFRILQLHTKLFSLSIDGCKKITDLDGIEMLQNLKYLSASNLSLSPEALTSRIPQLIRLEHLTLYKLSTSQINLKPLLELPLLKNLHVSFLGWNETNIYAAVPLQFESITMTSLCLANNKWITDNMFAQMSQGLSRLLELDIANTSITSSCIADNLREFRQMKHLGLQGLQLNDEDMSFLVNLKLLKKLNVSDTGLTDDFLTRKWLHCCTGLELLNLCRCSFTDSGLGCLKLPNLSTLWMDGCSISVDAAMSLTSASCPKISYLSLRNLLPTAADDDDEILGGDAFFD